jgi:hypothetical protein
MKQLIVIFALTLVSLAANAQTADCKCSYPLKENTSWCTGPKGGRYCINKNGNKTYQSSALKKGRTAPAAAAPAAQQPKQQPKPIAVKKTAKDL